MKFLIDECLSPDLAKLARERGYPESTHVRWLGLAGGKDHVVTRRAVDAGYVLVTHNTADFGGFIAVRIFMSVWSPSTQRRD